MDSHISEIFGDDRRRVLRRKVRLMASVSFIARVASVEARQRPLTVLAYTRDISADGLALIVPSIETGGDIREGGNFVLRIILALPSGDVAMDAVAVRHERLEESEPGMGYLIGVRITEMEAGERDLYLEYLHTLGGD